MWTYVMWTRRRAQEQGQDSWAAGAGRFPASSSCELSETQCQCWLLISPNSGRHKLARSGATRAPSMSTPDALSASDGGDAGSDIAACTAMLSRLTPSALRDDPALAPLLEAGVKLFGPEVPH